MTTLITSTSPNPAITNSQGVFDQLVPALVQCFGVIILGYLAGRWKIFPESQAKGLGSYVTKFALPSVFFRAMVTIDFAGICWLFVLAVSVSKLIAFLMAMTFTFLISRRCHLGIAAIVAMFVSQSNDVALAYPILNALFPDLANYVYLFAPVQLIVLNPFAYFLLELERVKSNTGELKPLMNNRMEIMNSQENANSLISNGNRFRQFMQVLFNVLKNPLLFMTVIGVIFNFILNHHLPIYVDGLLKVIADSFCATALFSLGYGMVGKMATVTQREGYILSIILLTKLLIVPFITRELVVRMMPVSLSNETLRYSTFGFLYGTTPTAPPVYLFAAEYQVIPVAIGIGLVLGTFLSAPIMFLFARIIMLYTATPSDYVNILSKTVEDVSWISIVCCIWTLGVICFSRKATRVPYRFTLCYIICVLLSCTGLLLGRLINQYSNTGMSTNVNQPAHWSHYIQFIIFYYGCTGTRCWTALIALILLMERARSLCFVLRHQFYIYATGFITPAVAIIILLFTSSGQTVIDINPVFQYGTNQLIISLIVLVVNTAVTLGCLITFKRMEPPVHDCYEIRETSTEGNKPSDELSHQLNDESSTGQEIISLQHMEQATQSNSVVSATNTTSCSHCNPANCLTLFDCGDCPGGKQKSQQHRQQSCDYTGFCDYCNQKQRKECAKIIACYCENHQQSTSSSSSSVPPRNQQISLQSELDSILTHGNVKPPHHKHVIFLILTLVTMFFGICLCTWRLVHDAPTGIYVVLEFMDGCLNSGQGVILFVLFGLDTDLFIFPLKRFLTRWFSQFSGKLYHGTFLESLNKEKIDKNEIDKIVNQFVKFHLQSCSKRIGHKKIVNSIHYDNVFYHFALEDWLIAAGITNTHENATFYIKCLELGNIIVCISPLVNTSSMMMMMMIMSSSDSQRLLTFTNYAWDLQNITY